MRTTAHSHMHTDTDSEFARTVYTLVGSVPAGCVASYGQIARLAGHPRHARFVGRLMARLPAQSRLPWWRILRSDGRLGLTGADADRQQNHLEAEGVSVIARRVSLRRFGWQC